MPTYEYECENLHIFTEARPIEMRDIGKCPECDTSNVRRLFGVVGIHFKGTGWGKDGYKK